MSKILLIDDDTNIHEIVSLFLEQAGHNVACVSSGPSGLDYAAQNRVDLIILDLAMPVMDGVETFSKLRAHPNCRDVPIMILSVHTQTEVGEDNISGDGVSFVNKPIDMQHLVHAVDTAIAG